MINKTIEPGNEFVKARLDEVKSHNSTDKLAADFVKFSENKYLNGETFQYPYTIKISFVDGKPYCFSVKDFAPPIQNAICLYKTHTPYLYNIVCDDGKNVKTKMKFNYPRDDDDGEYHPTEMIEGITTKFMYAYDRLAKGLTIIQEKKDRPFYSVTASGKKLIIKIDDKEDSLRRQSMKWEIIDMIFEQDDHQNYILKSYIINALKSNLEYSLTESKIMENCDPKRIETWNN
ncbi:MAG: hypothetical protein AB1656_06115 [Candidatus Omnitrophota bacterium]